MNLALALDECQEYSVWKLLVNPRLFPQAGSLGAAGIAVFRDAFGQGIAMDSKDFSGFGEVLLMS